jgi:hypothetical protein
MDGSMASLQTLHLRKDGQALYGFRFNTTNKTFHGVDANQPAERGGIRNGMRAYSIAGVLASDIKTSAAFINLCQDEAIDVVVYDTSFKTDFTSPLDTNQVYQMLKVLDCWGNLIPEETNNMKKVVTNEYNKILQESTMLNQQNFDNLKLDEIMEGMLAEDEKLVQYQSKDGFWIKHDGILLTDTETKTIQIMKPGYVVLSNRKLILVAHGKSEESLFEKNTFSKPADIERFKNERDINKYFAFPYVYPNGSQQTTFFSMGVTKSEAFEYIPVSLNHLVYATMNATHDNIVGHSLWYEQNCCLSCLSCCCACGSLLNWQNVNSRPINRAYNVRIIRVSAFLPPWNKKTDIIISVNLEVPLATMKDFISYLSTMTSDFNRSKLIPIMEHMK